jgi:hypothetical protein
MFPSLAQFGGAPVGNARGERLTRRPRRHYASPSMHGVSLSCRRSLATGVFALALGLAGCGTNNTDGVVVARVSGVGTITRGSVAHWANVEAVLVHELIPTRPAPVGLIPDPPNYSACIAYLSRTLSQSAGHKPPTTGALRHDCQARATSLQATTLSKLISWDWTIGRGEALGIRVSDAQVQTRLDTVSKEPNSPYGPSLTRYLALTGQTKADMLVRSRVQLYEVEIAERAMAMERTLPTTLNEHQRQAAIEALANRIDADKLWTGRTSCATGFVVPGCREYAGQGQPLSNGGT